MVGAGQYVTLVFLPLEGDAFAVVVAPGIGATVGGRGRLGNGVFVVHVNAVGHIGH